MKPRKPLKGVSKKPRHVKTFEKDVSKSYKNLVGVVGERKAKSFFKSLGVFKAAGFVSAVGAGKAGELVKRVGFSKADVLVRAIGGKRIEVDKAKELFAAVDVGVISEHLDFIITVLREGKSLPLIISYLKRKQK